MECYTTDCHTNNLDNHFKKHGIDCVREVTVGNRRFDLKCADINIEVKNRCEDYNSIRSKEQISDMKHYSDVLHEAFLVSTPCGCVEAKNEKGKEVIKKYNLIECPTESKLHCCSKESHEPE